MKSKWDPTAFAACGDSLLKQRVYSSQLLGQNGDLVLHGGGNTSVKITETDFFGTSQDILYVKGSGWDLATIEEAGFAPVALPTLIQMADCDHIDDTQMVRLQRSAMTNPDAPNPSVEAILHAIIPFTFVDHTHADPVVALSNSTNGPERLRTLFGPRVLFIPYVMPGFQLAKAVRDRTKNVDWSQVDALILLHHGVFTFNDDPKKSYEAMIDIVTKAEELLEELGATSAPSTGVRTPLTLADTRRVAALRKAASIVANRPLLVRFEGSELANGFASRNDVFSLCNTGPLTPDHVIQTKRVAAQFDGDVDGCIQAFTEAYSLYFETYQNAGQQRLDPAPRWGVWKNMGTLAIAPNEKRLRVVGDIVQHTIRAIQWGEHMGGWKALPAKDIFDVEYWELEQAKLKRVQTLGSLEGKVAIVTGAASGIGRACVQALSDAGAVVVALDIHESSFDSPLVHATACDVTVQRQIEQAICDTVTMFGGIDIVISNAGSFPENQTIANMEPDLWNQTLNINLNSHQCLLRVCAPYLKQGIDPAVILMGSKNVAAPGPGVAAYSVAKSGLVQLGRVAAMEWAPYGIRVNTVHPDGVYDTGIWTQDRIESRAAAYGLTVDEYTSRNLLKTTIRSKDVAQAVLALVGSTFRCTTGAQIPVDGGNDRVI